MARLTINKRWVREHADSYLDEFHGAKRELENDLFENVGPGAVERGYLERDELLQIASWKANRSSGHVKKNDVGRVKLVTGKALAGPDERALTLTSLFGVGTPMASAILTVCFPDSHTVYDVNALWTLREADKIPENRVGYGLYLSVCRELANQLGAFAGHVSPLRALDRALWKYADANMKQGKDESDDGGD